MRHLRQKLARLAAAFVASLCIVSGALANSTVILDYSGPTTPGVGFELTSSGLFQTTGGSALASFLNWGAPVEALDEVGKVKLSGVSLTGTGAAIAPGVFAQGTTGGVLEVFNSANSLLLSVSFTTGQLILSTVGTGSQFSIGTATFGGLYSSFLAASSATHALSLIGFSNVGLNAQHQLVASGGFGNGLVSGEPVPEPTSLLLLGTGLIGALRARRVKGVEY